MSSNSLTRVLRSRRRTRSGAAPSPFGAPLEPETSSDVIELEKRRDQLNAWLAEMQWDLGGLVYEMAVRDSVSVDLLMARAAELQSVDAELSELERILRLEQTATAGMCTNCGAPHSTGAAFCWQCGQQLLAERQGDVVAFG